MNMLEMKVQWKGAVTGSFRDKSLSDVADILVGGLEGQYFVRAGMDKWRWPTMDAMIKDLIADHKIRNLMPEDRERVMAAALLGFQQGRPEEDLEGFLPAHRL